MPKPKTPLTKRQRYWLRHINAADASGGTLVAYAKAHKLKVRDLYQWKTALGRRGLLRGKRAEPAGKSFVPVKPASPPPPPQRPGAQCTVTLPNGVRLDFSGGLGPESLHDLLQAASRLA
ncbi:MAG: hypothetical protein AAFR09_07520 [Pseudomonadota bacterium]